jgi:hypothetical protein
MQEIMLVNPAKRPSKRRKSRKAASPAQKRARAAFAAAARARSRKSKEHKVMANPKRRRARKANPARRHHHVAVRKSNPARRVHARRRRNPLTINAKPLALLTPALIGALGATVVNSVSNYLSPNLPASITGSTTLKYLPNIAVALGLAMLGSKMGGKRAMVMQAAEGSLTVTLHQVIVDLSGGMGMTLSGMRGMRGMGVYMPGAGARLPNASGNAGQMAGMNAYLTGHGSPQAAIQAQRQQALLNRARASNTGLRGMSFNR